MRYFLYAICIPVILMLIVYPGFCQNEEVIYDEAEVPEYNLPDPLSFSDGTKVDSEKEWQKRRTEILELFQEYVYGKMPGKPENMSFKVTKEVPYALDSLATLKEIRISFNEEQTSPSLNLLLFIPEEKEKPVPAFLGLNFRGNQSVHPSEHITITDQWVSNDENCNITNNTAGDGSRGCRQPRYPVERILDRGYAFATMYYGDIDPDFDDGFKNGIHQLFAEKYMNMQEGDNCASIGAWAYGLSRAMDYLEKSSFVDDERVALFGHSRLGKAALWAGACDTRFDIVISNCSGCGGAALSRRRFGETVERINDNFPHWFNENFKDYNDAEAQLPVDQHELIALMAPRPVFVASAEEDLWADPKGEFLSLKHAEPVYRLFGKNGLPVESVPVINRPVGYNMGYVIRNGEHDITNYNWEIYLDYADKHFSK